MNNHEQYSQYEMSIMATTTPPQQHDTNRTTYAGTKQYPIDTETTHPTEEGIVNFDMGWKGMLQASPERLSRDSSSGDLYHKMCEFCGDPGGLNGVVVPPPDWLTEEVDRKQWLKRDQNALLYFYYKTSKYKKHMQKIIDQSACDFCCNAHFPSDLFSWQRAEQKWLNTLPYSERAKYIITHDTHDFAAEDPRDEFENDGCTYYMGTTMKPMGEKDYVAVDEHNFCCHICLLSTLNCCGCDPTAPGLAVVMSYLYNDKSIKDATQYDRWCCHPFCLDIMPKTYFSFYERLKLAGFNIQKRYDGLGLRNAYQQNVVTTTTNPSHDAATSAATQNLPEEVPFTNSCCYMCWCGTCEAARMSTLTSYYIRKRYGGDLRQSDAVYIKDDVPGYGTHRAMWTALHRISTDHTEWMKMISAHNSGHPYSYKLKWNAQHNLPWTGLRSTKAAVIVQKEHLHHLVWGRERVGAKYITDPPVNIPGKEPEPWAWREWQVPGHGMTAWTHFAQLPVGLFEDWIDVNKTVDQHNAMWHNLRSITLHLNAKDMEMD